MRDTIYRAFRAFAVLALWFGAVSSLHAQVLEGSVSLNRAGLPTWAYTVVNDEPQGGGNWITSLYLPVGAHIDNVQGPANWTIETDYQTYVLWYNAEPFPYEHDLPPATATSGFSLSSAAAQTQDVEYVLGSWNHMADDSGPSVSGNVAAPYVAQVPEPHALSLASAFILVVIAGRVRRQNPKVVR